MDWQNPVWLYCERGTQITLFAEPFNAASNISFLIAAGAALWLYFGLPSHKRSADHLLLIGLTLLVGAGSLLFHLFANQWSETADVIPIFLFMLAYLAHALNRFAQVPPAATMVLVLLFAAITAAAMTMTCGPFDLAFRPAWVKESQTACMNGSLGYVPALIALWLMALVTWRKRHKAALSLLGGGFVFLVSLGFRTVDHYVCGTWQWQGQAIGSHFVWHLLNGLLLFILLRAALVHQTPEAVCEIIPPTPRDESET